jgi:uroporphyrin-III C-methyltransferase
MTSAARADAYSQILFDGLPVFEPGWVWLVGGGPGDRGLLTLHAVNAIRQADAIIYDALVDEAILTFAREDVLVEFAGKRGGRPSPLQKDINLRLIDLAREGKRVLRLKGGDPFVFGRGGEEALGLVEAGIPFRVVPGITAGIGGLCYAGIPATHRDVNQSVTFLTGHDQSGALPTALDWDAIARGSQVIVMYMAMKHIEPIADKLLRAGRNPDEGAALICNASTPRQAVMTTTLAKLAEDTARSGLKPPALFVIGDVVKLRDGLDWLGFVQEGRQLISDPLGKAKDRPNHA